MSFLYVAPSRKNFLARVWGSEPLYLWNNVLSSEDQARHPCAPQLILEGDGYSGGKQIGRVKTDRIDLICVEVESRPHLSRG